jgi:hypothetical protein
MQSRLVPWVLVALGAFAFAAAPPEKPAKEPKDKDKTTAADKAKRRAEIDDYFTAPLKRITIDLKPEAVEQLRAEPRLYVEGKLAEADTEHKHVAIKLKGAEGSFKPIDEKPAMTLDFDKYKGAERFHGQKKMHLNNANEDASFLREWVAGEIARAAGVPAGRCTHAMVSINGKDKGLYVVRESFTKDFLMSHFGEDKGGLFEGHFCKDLDLELELDSGPDTAREALKELLAACEVPDATARWERLSKVLDVDAFAAHLAMEQVLDFWDSYDFNRNNYRLYLHKGRFRFVLHGMDQVLREPEVSLQREPGSRVGQAFWSCAPGRVLYRKKITEIYEKVLRPKDWSAAVAARADAVQAMMKANGSRKVREFMQQAEALRSDLGKRIESIGEQLGNWPEPLVFDAKGVAALSKDWHEENENGDSAALDEDAPGGKTALRVTAKEESTASWRRAVLLEAGKYRFEAAARTKGVEALDDEKGRGVGLRISGAQSKRQNGLAGDTTWTDLRYDFDLDEAREVILVAELRARKGEVWFARDSLRLVKVK